MQLDALTEYWGLTPWAEQPDDVQDGVVADLYVTEDDSEWYWLYFVMKNYLTPNYESPISQTIVSYTVNDFSSNFQEYSVIQERLGLAKTAYLAEVAKYAPSGGGGGGAGPSLPDNIYVLNLDTIGSTLSFPDGLSWDTSSISQRFNNSTSACFFFVPGNSVSVGSGGGFTDGSIPALFYDVNSPYSWNVYVATNSNPLYYLDLYYGSTPWRNTSVLPSYLAVSGFSRYYSYANGYYTNSTVHLLVKGDYAVNGVIFSGSVEPEPETPTDPAGPPAPPGYTRPTGGTTVVTGTTTSDGFDLDLTPVTDWLRTINENLTEFFGWYKEFADWLDEWFTTFIDQIRECCVGVRSLLEQILEVVRQIFYRMGFAGNPGHPDPVENPDEFANWFDKTVTDFVSKLPGTLQTALVRLQELTTRFPFSIPWDLMALFALFNHAPVTPVYDLDVPYIGGDTYTLHIDLSPYNDLAALARRAEVMLFTLALVLRTKWLTDALSPSTVKGGKDG